MRRIGVDQELAEIYESAGNYWRIALPSPIVTGAILDPVLPIDPSVVRQATWYIFREDHFDPTARIRRGRFYVPALGQCPSQQYVLPRLAGDAIQGAFEKFLFVYDEYQLSRGANIPKIVVLGTLDWFSLWQIASPPERISTGELLFVLKARHNFGILPEVDYASVPEIGRAKVAETLAMLTEAAHRESPGSIIHRARDAAQWCLATWAPAKYEDARLLTHDLGATLKKIGKDRWTATRAGEVIKVLHSNAKPNEQERHGSRPPMEDDAELAVKGIALIIRELGWELV